MTKQHAIIDAQSRAERSGLSWHVIKIKKTLLRSSYDTVTQDHVDNYSHLYKSGKFKVIETFEPTIKQES